MGKIITYLLRITPEKTGAQPQYHAFKTFTATNGKSVYTVNGELTDKDAGNERFKELIQTGVAEKQITEQELSDDEIKDYLLNSMDPWTSEEANDPQDDAIKAQNSNLMDTLDAFEKIAG